MTLPQHLEPLLDRGEESSNEDDPAYQFLNEVIVVVISRLIFK